ncbi:hypothetical protein D3C80_2163310 [compost metagenome]
MTLGQVLANRQRVGDDAVLGLEQGHFAGRGKRQDARARIGLVEFDQGFFIRNTGQFQGQGAA